MTVSQEAASGALAGHQASRHRPVSSHDVHRPTAGTQTVGKDVSGHRRPHEQNPPRARPLGRSGDPASAGRREGVQ